MNALNPWPWQTLEPGIYFNLPFDQYVAQPCLNAGGLKNLLVSAPDFWFRSWMNPLCDEIDEDTKAKTEGRAYHKRILEGLDEFWKVYAPEFEYNGSAPLLRTSEDISGALAIRGLPSTFKRKQEGIDRLLAADPNAQIYDAMAAAHRKQFGDREFLDQKFLRHIEYAARMIEFHPELQTYFVGGYPEVTVIWDDDELGVRFKIRMDYAKVGPVVDLKSFANQMKKSIEKAIDYAIASNKYHIQARLYLKGREAARKLVMDGKVFGAENVDPAWLKSFAETPNDEFWYIFQQKGIAPVAHGDKFTLKDSKFSDTSWACLEDACNKFKTCYKIFGEDAWVDISPSRYISFDQLPAFIGDV